MWRKGDGQEIYSERVAKMVQTSERRFAIRIYCVFVNFGHRNRRNRAVENGNEYLKAQIFGLCKLFELIVGKRLAYAAAAVLHSFQSIQIVYTKSSSCKAGVYERCICCCFALTADDFALDHRAARRSRRANGRSRIRELLYNRLQSTQSVCCTHEPVCVAHAS